MRGREIDLLEVGLYGVPQAAQLVRAPYNKIRGWVFGYPGVKAAPIIHCQLNPLNGRLAMGFLDLMEVRFIREFAKLNINVRRLRRAFSVARKLLNHDHPFATESVKFETDKRKVFALVFEETEDPYIYDLMDDNYAMYEAIEQSLFRDVAFDPHGNATIWYPRKEVADDVVLDPKRSFGQPIVASVGIPTATLFSAFRAEKDLDATADWYEIEPHHVDQAVRFEKALIGESLAVA